MRNRILMIVPAMFLTACSSHPVLPTKDDIKISREAPEEDDCKYLGPIEGRTTKVDGKTEDALEDLKLEAIKKGASHVQMETIGALGTSVRGKAFYCK